MHRPTELGRQRGQLRVKGVLASLVLAGLVLTTPAAAQDFTEDELQRLYAAALEIQSRGLTGGTIDEAYALEEIYYRYDLPSMMSARGLATSLVLTDTTATGAAAKCQEGIDAQGLWECPAQDCAQLALLELRLSQLEGTLAAGGVLWGVAAALGLPFTTPFAVVSGAYFLSALGVGQYRNQIGYTCRQGLACP